ncbi:MAG TPA: Ig-like domain-containing protein [Burkholderiales bacterium]
MLNMRKKILVTALGLATFAGASQAALQAVDPGPYTAATGFFPLFYTDTNNLSLDLCLSKSVGPNGPLCTLLANPGVFDPAQPVVFPTNFPDEAFYFTADATVAGQGINLIYVGHLEAAFAAGLPVPGDQITFSRIRIRADIDVTVPGPGNYRVTHPYGVENFTAVNAGRRVINLTRDIGIGAAGDFSGALAGDIGPFLRRSASAGGAALPFIPGLDPVTLAPNGEQFIGDPNVTQFATGSPFGTNFVRVQRVDAPGIDVTTDQFFLSGQVFNGQRPTPVAVDRASYSRTVDPVTHAVTTRIDGFATSTPTASVCFRETADFVAGNPCQFNMTGDGAGKFFAQDPNAPVVPPFIVVTASDPNAVPPTTPTPIAQALGDVVKTTKVQFAKDTKTLIIEATSSDEAAPPKITAVGLGVLIPIPGTIAGQRLQTVLPAEPPAFVTLVSSGGGRDTEPVTVVATAAANQAPVANPDTATTAEDTPVNIPVLANDTDADGNVLTVTGVSGATNGTATVNADGTVRFAPALNFNGTGSFNYAISDGNGGTASSSVTVTVTAVNDAPLAVNDSATTATNTAVTINVLANDSDPDNIPPAAANAGLTVSAVTQPANGTVVINNPATSVRYTPNANFSGTNTFTYTVSDGSLTATATVTVNVQAGVDLDIARFTVPNNGRVGRALSAVSINVNNGGTVNAPRTATLTGTQNGVQVYNRSLQVSDPVGGGTSQFAFPAFTPTATGNITWRVEIFDDNADVDVATGTTSVPR